MTHGERPAAGDQPEAEQAIRRLARMAMPGPGRGLQHQREMVLAIAADLRRATAGDAASPEVSPGSRALARVVGELPPGTDQDLADLRLFARATLAESADLLGTAPGTLRQRWKVLRATLFRRARSRR